MRIAEPFSSATYAPRRLAGARSAAVFRLPDAVGPAAAQAAQGATAASLFQSRRQEQQQEQRRRIVRSGRGLLDALDQLKLALLSGNPAEALQALAARLGQAGERANDPALDDILDHIRLRADVELAKAQRRSEQGQLQPGDQQHQPERAQHSGV